MMNYLDKARVYHCAIRDILFNEWDPIGINHIASAADEYDSYVPEVYKLLIRRRTRTDIFDYLWELETSHMGLSGNRRHTENVADQLLNIPNQFDLPEV